MSKQNMALLSQSEIDTLISFLSNEKDKSGVGSEVLSQDSIDKLISIIKTGNATSEQFKIHLPVSTSENEKVVAFFKNADKTYSDTAAYELLFEKKRGKISVNGKNTQSGALVPIRPCDVADGAPASEDNWGACIMPALFDLIASHFHIKYTKDTMDAVCAVFAKVMFGKEDASIPAVYLPAKETAGNNVVG